VREGKSLASALATAPIAIPALVIGIAKAGEAGQGIGPAIRRAAELSEATAETRAAVRSALAYPLVVAAAGVGAIILLITVVLPRFAAILADLGQTLPASTQFVLRVSTVAKVALLPAAGMIALAFVVWRAWTSTDAGRARWHNWLLQLPLIGSIRLGLGTARMAQSLAALLENGVPISGALLLSARATGDGELEQRVLAARQRIGAGDTISHAIDEAGAATPTTVRLMRAGEESGRLASMLLHAAHIEQQRVDRIVRTGVRMLEPILLLTFASVVAFVAAALLQAIYSVRPTA
jgi:type II secretory pathway component PulF